MSSVTASTPAAAAIGGFSEAAFEASLASRDEPRWLVDRRRAAFQAFKSTPLPTTRDDEWRRTDIRALKLDNFGPPTIDPSVDAIAAMEAAHATLASYCATGIQQVNGRVTRTADTSKLGGAILLDLATAAAEYPQILEKYLASDPAVVGGDAFSMMHAAFRTGGVMLYVPKGVKVDVPLYSLVGLGAEGNVDLDHTLVVLEEGAEATLVRETTGIGRAEAPGFHNGGVALHLAAGSKLRFVNIQNWDQATWHFSRERAYVGAEAKLQWTVGGLGSRLSKVNQEVALAGEKADAQVNGILFTSGRQHLSYFTRQDHQAPRTTSDLLYKGGLKDKSRIVWKGMIRVEKAAQKTDAYQKNDSLLLADTARADSIPGLEIEANDVRCTHGATAGRVDEEMVFYAQARGIERETAVRLIVEGFFAKVYDRVEMEPVQETLRQAVATKLNL
ncbi:Fe-S cluster assembly protein SufD [Isosphaeraceae bacterium EP7]